MPWTPEISVFDERSVKDNLIDYFEANQADALLWANGGVTPLQSIRDFHKSPRLTSIFPALTFLQTEHKAIFNDILIVTFSLVLEVALIHGNQDTLTDMGPIYAMALESMLTNVPETTFNQDSIIQVNSTIGGYETSFDVQGKLKNKYIQIFQTRASWQIEASAY
mgnify:CR=1 FL=1